MRNQACNGFSNAIGIICLVACAVTADAAHAQSSTQDLLPIPFPNLSGLGDEPREILSKAREQFERAATKQTGRELGVAYGRLGMVYQNWQFHPATVAAYTNAIALVPDDAHWSYYLALHFEETGELEKAVTYYQQSLELNPEYANTWLRIAEVFLELNNLPAAKRGYDAALQLQPDMVAAIAGLGTVALRNQDYERAIELLSRAVDMQPEADQLNYRLAQAYRKTGGIAKAREYLAKSGRRIASAPDPWVDIMKTRAKSARHFVDLGEAAMQARDFQIAAQNFNIAVTMEPEYTRALMRLAAALTILNRNEAALATIEKVLLLVPDNTQALLTKGNVLEALKRFADALEPYHRAVRLDPGNQVARFAYANNLMRNERYAEAAVQYQVRRQAQASDVAARYWLALAYAAANECGNALTPLAEAVQLQPGILELTMANVRIVASCETATKAQVQTAIKLGAQLLTYQRTGDHLETMAMVMAADGQYTAAAALQTEAIALGTVRGGDAALPFLQENLERYKGEIAAEKPWAIGSPVYFPPLPRTQ